MHSLSEIRNVLEFQNWSQVSHFSFKDFEGILEEVEGILKEFDGIWRNLKDFQGFRMILKDVKEF